MENESIHSKFTKIKMTFVGNFVSVFAGFSETELRLTMCVRYVLIFLEQCPNYFQLHYFKYANCDFKFFNMFFFVCRCDWWECINMIEAVNF